MARCWLLRAGRRAKQKILLRPLVRPIKVKPAKAQDESRQFLFMLPREILLEILEMLSIMHQPTIKAVSETCSELYHLSRRIGLTICLDLTQGPAESKTRRILESLVKSESLTYVHTIIITNAEIQCWCMSCKDQSIPSFKPAEDVLPETVPLLQGILPGMTNLQDVHWMHDTFCHIIFDGLRQCPKIRLHAASEGWKYGHKKLREAIQGPQHLTLLESNQTLISLNFTYCYLNREDLIKYTKVLRTILLTCKNLRDLTIDIPLVPSSPCVSHFQPYEYGGIGFVNGEKPAALESFILKAYPFHMQCTMASGYPGIGPEQKDWAETFDWSRLKTFYSFDMEFAARAAPRLSAVEDVSLGKILLPQTPQDVNTFYRDIRNGLRKLSVVRLEDIAVEDILRHGAALQDLEIHQAEDPYVNWRTEAVDLELIKQIRDSCPNIRNLRIDLSRSDEWPLEALEVIASFPRLEKLTIWFELGVVDGTDHSLPLVTFNTADMLFRFTKRHNTHQSTSFHEMIIHSGSTPQPRLARDDFMRFLIKNSTCYVFKVSDDQEKAARGIYTRCCSNVSSDENRYLRGEISLKELDDIRGKIPQEKRFYNPEFNPKMTRVAEHGPQSRQLWLRENPNDCTVM